MARMEKKKCMKPYTTVENRIKMEKHTDIECEISKMSNGGIIPFTDHKVNQRNDYGRNSAA